MTLPTDRGLVVISDRADGTHTVAICARVVDGAPRNTFATHFRARVAVDADVALVRGAAGRYTTEIVEVFRDDGGTVRVCRPRP
jgi:hypothetical protein